MAELARATRTAFLSGISPAKWQGLIIALIPKLQPPPPADLVASTICDAILSLLSSFPGDRTLREYIQLAVIEGSFVTLPHLVSTFLRSVRATEYDASTLNMICQLILNIHYESRAPPLGSLIPYSQLPSELLDTISDSLYLLRLSYEFPASPFHRLTALASDLLVLTLSCVGDISEVSTAQATVLLSDLHDVLQIVTLQANVRQALDSFLFSLSMLLGDGTKQAEEAAMLASFQLSPGKQDSAGLNPSLDIFTGGLIMARLISRRATGSGTGCEWVTVTILVAWYRASMSPLAVFYAHAILSAVACLSQESQDTVDPVRGFIWKCFILGRMPYLLQKCQERIIADGLDPEAGNGVAMHTAIAQVFARGDLLDQCEPSMRASVPPSSDAMDEDSKGPTFRYELIAALVSAGLLDPTFVHELIPPFPHEFPTKLSVEVQEFGTEVETFIESKLSLDATLDDTVNFLDRISTDYRSHSVVAGVLHQKFVQACQMLDVEALSRLCKIMSQHDPTLDIVSLHISIHDLISHALVCLEDYDLTAVGDPQTAVSQLGEVVLFLQSVFARYKISTPTFKVGDRILRTDSLHSCSVVFLRESLSGDDQATLDAWSRAIFDSKSEGIDDEILRSTKPKTLLRLSATLFSEAIAACGAQRIDVDALKNGVSFYLGPLLSWTLVGVVQALLEEVERSSFQNSRHLAVLDAILMDKSCPNVVLRITRQQILRLQSDPKSHIQAPAGAPSVNKLVNHVLKGAALPLSSAANQPGSWTSQPRDMIRHTIASADAGKVSHFDVEQCLATLGVRAFFDFFWRELLAAAAMGKIEICRRFATFVLTSTSSPVPECSSNFPPLLPIFLHVYLPSLLRFIDEQAPSEQGLSVQLLGAIIASALTFSVNLDRAVLKPTDNDVLREIKMHNLPCSAMARKLRIGLRKAKSSSGLALFQKLSVSSSFVSTFPVFVSG